MDEFVTMSATFGTLVLLDGIYLGVLRKQFYKNAIEKTQHAPMEWSWSPTHRQVYALLLVYLIVSVFVYYFVLDLSDSGLSAFAYGGSAGLLLYGLYNCTNVAIFKDYPLDLAFSDSLWGSAVVAAASVSGHYALGGMRS